MANTLSYLYNKGTPELISNEIDVRGVLDTEINSHIFWNDETEFEKIFFDDAPQEPVVPPVFPSPPDVAIGRDRLFNAYRQRVFSSYRQRVFKS